MALATILTYVKQLTQSLMCVVDKTLVNPDDEGASAEWRMQMVELFKAKQIAEARKLIVAKARTDEYNDILLGCTEILIYTQKVMTFMMK